MLTLKESTLTLEESGGITDRARKVVLTLIQFGLPVHRQSEAMALIHLSLVEMEAEARRWQRNEMYAEMLAEALPYEVLVAAAEKVVGRGY